VQRVVEVEEPVTEPVAKHVKTFYGGKKGQKAPAATVTTAEVHQPPPSGSTSNIIFPYVYIYIYFIISACLCR
jgi:hypothetical protein